MSQPRPDMNIVTAAAIGPTVVTIGLLALLQFIETGELSVSNVDEDLQWRIWGLWAILAELGFVVLVLSIPIGLAIGGIQPPEAISIEVTT
jgi:hypothetical protein